MAKDAGVRSIDELRHFASYLNNLGDNLINEFNHARNEMYHINDGWNDSENEKFMEEFEQSITIINRIALHMQEYGTFINKKSDILDMYQNTKL